MLGMISTCVPRFMRVLYAVVEILGTTLGWDVDGKFSPPLSLIYRGEPIQTSFRKHARSSGQQLSTAWKLVELPSAMLNSKSGEECSILRGIPFPAPKKSLRTQHYQFGCKYFSPCRDMSNSKSKGRYLRGRRFCAPRGGEKAVLIRG